MTELNVSLGDINLALNNLQIGTIPYICSNFSDFNETLIIAINNSWCSSSTSFQLVQGQYYRQVGVVLETPFLCSVQWKWLVS